MTETLQNITSFWKQWRPLFECSLSVHVFSVEKVDKSLNNSELFLTELTNLLEQDQDESGEHLFKQE